MVLGSAWRGEAFEAFLQHYAPVPSVVGLLELGSGAIGTVDRWSDVDLLAIVRDEGWRTVWPVCLPPLGEVFAREERETEGGGVAKFVFTDFRRLDLVVVRASSLGHQSWPLLEAQATIHVLFAKTAEVEALKHVTGKRPAPPLISEAQFEQLAEQFWFRSAMAIEKVIRNDLLIALHLC
jgi:hypothetical protein